MTHRGRISELVACILTGTALVALSACASLERPAPAVMPAASAREIFVYRPGTRLAVRVVGPDRGPTLIALAGGPGYSHGYMEAIERLTVATPSMRVVTYDARGTGNSIARPDATFTLADTLADVDAVRSAVGATTVTFLGHSYGALIAEAYATTRPEHVRALILVDAMPNRKIDLKRAAEASRARALALRAEGYQEPPPAVGDDCDAAMNAELPIDFADPHHAAARSLQHTKCSVGTAGKTFAGLGDYDLASAMGSLRMPVLLAFGDADTGRFELEALLAQLSSATPVVATFAACGHYPFLECPDAFFESVAAFLASVP